MLFEADLCVRLYHQITFSYRYKFGIRLTHSPHAPLYGLTKKWLQLRDAPYNATRRSMRNGAFANLAIGRVASCSHVRTVSTQRKLLARTRSGRTHHHFSPRTALLLLLLLLTTTSPRLPSQPAVLAVRLVPFPRVPTRPRRQSNPKSFPIFSPPALVTRAPTRLSDPSLPRHLIPKYVHPRLLIEPKPSE